MNDIFYLDFKYTDSSSQLQEYKNNELIPDAIKERSFNANQLLNKQMNLLRNFPDWFSRKNEIENIDEIKVDDVEIIEDIVIPNNNKTIIETLDLSDSIKNTLLILKSVDTKSYNNLVYKLLKLPKTKEKINFNPYQPMPLLSAILSSTRLYDIETINGNILIGESSNELYHIDDNLIRFLK